VGAKAEQRVNRAGPVPGRVSGIRGTLITPGRIDKFMEAIDTGSEDLEAAEYAEVKLTSMKQKIREDPDLQARYRQARENRIEWYRREAKRRAIDGWLEPVFQRGEQIGVIRKHSDRMLEVLLRAEDPETFGDRKVVEILTSPMTGQDVARAVAAGVALQNLPGGLEQLEAVAAYFADQAVLEASATPGDPDSFEVR
jgi:hypothetical protein